MNVEPSTALVVTPQDAASFALPVEGHIVTAALALDAAQSKAAIALALIQLNARDEATVLPALNNLVNAVNRATEAYHAYSLVRSCAGQA